MPKQSGEELLLLQTKDNNLETLLDTQVVPYDTGAFLTEINLVATVSQHEHLIGC
jgi:hypothetical protein